MIKVFDPIFCYFNQFVSVLKNKFCVSARYYFWYKSDFFLAIKNFCCQWARSGHANKCPFHWHLEFGMASLFSAFVFLSRNHAIVSCYATARPGISAWSNRWLPPFMWKASWQWRLIRLYKFQPSQSKEHVLYKWIRHPWKEWTRSLLSGIQAWCPMDSEKVRA